MPKRKSYLKGGDIALGSMDDMFYIAETWFKKGGRAVGKTLGMTPKEIKKRNKLLKTLKELASKGHYTHSPLQRKIRLVRRLKKPVFKTPLKKLKKISKRFPKL